MKLLLDHNLSHRLVHRLADIFPESTQTKLLGFNRAADTFIWEHARANSFVVVTLDKRSHNLLLVQSRLAGTSTPMPWFGNKALHLQFS